MRKRYVYDKQGNAIEISGDSAIAVRVHEVMGDIKPYRSMIDGSIIEGRRQHEEHLKRHGARQVDPSEVATEKILNHKPNYDFAPEQRHELIRAQIDAMSQKEFKAALQRDIDRIKWNSRTN